MSSLTLPYSRWYSAFNFFLNHLLLFALLLTEYNMYSKSPTHEWGQFWEYVHKSNFFVSPTKLSWVPANKILYLVLYCNRFVIVSANIIHSKQKTNTKNKEKIFNLTVPWKVQFSSVQSLSLCHVQFFVTPWVAAHQAPLSITNFQSWLKPMPIESEIPASHLILHRPLLLLPPIPPSIRVFSNESTLRMRWPKYWNSWARSHLWKFITWRFISRGLNVFNYHL